MGERASALLRDPRHYQIAVLSGLLAYGCVALDFEVRPEIVLAIGTAALSTQLAASWAAGIPVELRSACISALSLSLLLRTTSPLTATAAAVLAIGSKFALRRRGKHVFNPTAFGIAAVLLFADDAWVSAGQWGTGPILALALVGFGALVVRRARRADVTWAFGAFYVAMLFGRAWWLGDPPAIPLLALRSGSLLIFAFLMISDPRTTPDSRAGRILFAGLVAAGALGLRFGLHHTNGLIWSLVACAPLVPWIDRLLPGDRYRWAGARPNRVSLPGGRLDAEQDDLGRLPAGWRAAR